MMLEEAISQACATVGIIPPRGRIDQNKWIKADVAGKGASGKGDGRVICDDFRATAMNWTTGESVTVWLKENFTPTERKRFAENKAKDEREDRQRAERAAGIASKLISTAKPRQHPYLAAKGFPNETAPTIEAEAVREIGGAYLVPDSADFAVLVPVRLGQKVTSAQLIWSDGTKKFLYGGNMAGASHRIATGTDTWLCEGFATALSIKAALRGLSRRDTILVCFSASNIAKVAKAISGRRFIAADHDAPPKAKPDQFGGLGAGEHFARQAGVPYAMPPREGDDFNDMHKREGIFAVQRVLSQMTKRARHA